MSQAQTVIVSAERIPIPVGCQPRQVKLARLALERDPDSDEALWKMVAEAGYSLTTAKAMARRTLTAVGVERATAALVRSQADSARGLAGISLKALKYADEDIPFLRPDERLGVGLKFAEAAANLGENLETAGSADAWKQRVLRYCRLTARLTEARVRRELQHLVLPPHPTETTG